MRTEVKFAIVVVLVAMIGAAMYFFSRGSEKPIELTLPKALNQSGSPKAEDIPLPLGRSGGNVTERTVEPSPAPDKLSNSIASADVEETETSPEPTVRTNKPEVKVTIDLNPINSSAQTSRPSKTTARHSGSSNSESANRVVPNQPNAVDLSSISDEKETKTEGVSAEKPLDASSSTSTVTGSATVHVVKPSETLYSIAKQYYGNGEKWKLIAQANKNLTPGKIRAGMKLNIPENAGKAKAKETAKETVKDSSKENASASGSDSKNSETASAKNSKNSKKEKESAGEKVDKSKLRTHKVKDGESFYTISRDELGAGSRWKEVFELNKSKYAKPEHIRAGQTIYLPAK